MNWLLLLLAFSQQEGSLLCTINPYGNVFTSAVDLRTPAAGINENLPTPVTKAAHLETGTAFISLC